MTISRDNVFDHATKKKVTKCDRLDNMLHPHNASKSVSEKIEPPPLRRSLTIKTKGMQKYFEKISKIPLNKRTEKERNAFTGYYTTPDDKNATEYNFDGLICYTTQICNIDSSPLFFSDPDKYET